MNAMKARRMYVEIDQSSIGPLRAWTFGETFGRWEVPYFEYREAKRVATTFDAATDTFYTYIGANEPSEEDFARLGDPDDPDWVIWEPSVIDTPEGPKKVWSAAAGIFTWERVEDPREQQARRNRTMNARRGVPAAGFRVKLLEGGWVAVPSFEAASAAISAERDELGVGSADWDRDTGHVIDAQGRVVARISYNGRIWPEGSKYGPGVRESRRRR